MKLRFLFLSLLLAVSAHSQGVKLNIYTTSSIAPTMVQGRIALIGDSIGESFSWFNDLFTLYPEFSGYQHTNISHSGWTTTMQATNVQNITNWLARTGSNQLRYGIIELGLNDSAKFGTDPNDANTWTNAIETRTSFRSIMAKLTNVGATPVVATLYRYGAANAAYQFHLDIINEIIRSNAPFYGAILWDLKRGVDPENLYDGTHPTNAGVVQIRKSLYQFMKEDARIFNVSEDSNVVSITTGRKPLVLGHDGGTNLFLTNGINSSIGRLDVHPTLTGVDFFNVYDTNGTIRFRIGVYPDFPNICIVYMGNITPALNNFAFYSEGTQLVINGVDSILFGVAGMAPWKLISTGALITGTDDAIDLGMNGKRVRDLYLNRGTYFQSNAVTVATVKAGITNGGSWVGMLSNALQVVSMSNNVTSFKILYP